LILQTKGVFAMLLSLIVHLGQSKIIINRLKFTHSKSYSHITDGVRAKRVAIFNRASAKIKSNL